jgi:hypothetical protein
VEREAVQDQGQVAGILTASSKLPLTLLPLVSLLLRTSQIAEDTIKSMAEAAQELAASPEVVIQVRILSVTSAREVNASV